MHISRSKYSLVRGIIVCSVLFLGLGIVKILFDMAFQQFMGNRCAELHSAANVVNNYFNENLMELKLLSRRIDLKNMESVEVELKLHEIFKLGVFSASVFDLEGNLLANAVLSDCHAGRIEDYDGFKWALSGYDHVSDVFFDDTMGRSYIIIHVPIVDMQGRVTGVLESKLDIKKMNALLPVLYNENGTCSYILDSESRCLHCPKEKTVQLTAGNGESFEKSLFLESKYIDLHQKLEHSSWCIDAVIPTIFFYKSIACALLMPLILLILCAVIIILTIWLFYKERQHQKAYAMIRIESLTTAARVAAGVAHEIKNPLSSLKGFVQLMLKKNQEDKKVDYLTIMQDEIERIECLTNQFCMLSKPMDKVAYKTVDLQELIRKIIVLFEQQAVQQKVSLTMIPSATLDKQFLIQGNTNQLKQVLINLIRNAIEAVREKGRVSISCQKDKGNIVLRIQDNGIGISPSDLKHLGTPFYTTKENGNGLGLLVSFEIIRQHGGKIEIESYINEGTTVQITLPEVKK